MPDLFVYKIKKIISNNSIRDNLLSLFLMIIILMSFMFVVVVFYSVDSNRAHDRLMRNFVSYSKIYSSVNFLDKDIYMNITEQKNYDGNYYDKLVIDIQQELNKIQGNSSDSDVIASIEILKRTTGTLGVYLDKIDKSIISDASYQYREELLNSVIHIQDLIKENTQQLMETDLAAAQFKIKKLKYAYNFALCLIVLFFIISVLSSILLLILVLDDTTSKINTLSEQANSLANGDLTIEPISFGEDNEFNVLALSFNKMKNNIKDYIGQLASSESRVSSILNTLNDCVITTDTDGLIESVNDAIISAFEYKRKEVIGCNISQLINAIDFSLYNSEAYKKQKLIKNIKAIDEKYQVEGVKKDGEVFPIELSYNEIELEEKRLITFVVHDITQHKNLEKMKDEFISVVSHELRTPLTSIKGSLGLLTSGMFGEFTDKANSLLSIANKNCVRLIDLINDILDLEKIKAGKMDFVMGVQDIVPIVNEAIDATAEYAKQYNVTYDIVESIDSANINVDKKRLIQVLFNLLSNAAKFSHSDSKVDVRIVRNFKGIVEISVQDHGIGIPEDFKSKVYNNFSQADSSDARKKGGTGLGLSITKELVTKMGGNIGFKSVVGEGTQFFVEFKEIV